jgi:hypothetical protein
VRDDDDDDDDDVVVVVVAVIAGVIARSRWIHCRAEWHRLLSRRSVHVLPVWQCASVSCALYGALVVLMLRAQVEAVFVDNNSVTCVVPAYVPDKSATRLDLFHV